MKNVDDEVMIFLYFVFSYEWWVPLTYTTKTENNFNKNRADVKWFNSTSQGMTP
jgi:hypothetical protein